MSQFSSVDSATFSVWTDEKSASIDWADPDDVLGNGWTFLRIMGFHPALAQYAATHADEKERWQMIFKNSFYFEEQKKALRWWLENGLLLLREERWCRRCGVQGHTRRTCDQPCHRVTDEKTAVTGEDSKKTEPSRIMSRFIAHQVEVERCKILREKQWKEGSVAMVRRKGPNEAQKKRTDSIFAASARVKKELTLFAEERRRGVVGRIDTQYGIGFVRVSELGEVKFFMDRVDYGVKEMAVGDAVTLKVDHSRDYPLAVDIRLERVNITLEDLEKFLRRCKTTTRPIAIIKTIMTHTNEWSSVLGLLRNMPGPAFVDGVHTIVELTTFIGNREPIHIPLLVSFFSLMLRALKKSDVPAFFPTLVLDALVIGGDMKPEGEMSLIIERWIEVADFIVLVRHFANVSEDVLREVQLKLVSLLTRYVDIGSTPATSTITGTTAAALRRKVDAALLRLQHPPGCREAALLIPSATEFSFPPPDPKSIFTPQNLPVNGAIEYELIEPFITDHCRLLRADTFEAVSRILPAVCFELPNYKPTADTEAAVPHARVYDNLRLVGRVVTRDKDYAVPDSYIFQVRPKSPKADIFSDLLPGTTVCITTGLDRTVVSADEVFWGIVTSCNLQLLACHMIVLAPCESSAGFDILAGNLRRNEQLGKLDHSCLLSTSIFMIGYQSIFKALGAFVGPLAMSLPMSSTLVSAKAAENALVARKLKSNESGGFVSYIPPQCESAFLEVVDSVADRFVLDDGQKEVMRCLPTSDILLVQGPPGTGKSFIGCRVVEVYIRYKQLIASGDIFCSLDVDRLFSTSTSDMLPTLGPIVVITYKNHALDEFLTDMLRSGLWDNERPRIAQQWFSGTSNVNLDCFPAGKRIVRIGGRSRQLELDIYNLSTLIHARSDKVVLNSLKERLFLMNQRLERLLKEIHYLESGRVPKTLFERWLTEEQSKSMRYEDRDAWLEGKDYIGTSKRTAEKTLYMTFLQTKISYFLEEASRCQLDTASLQQKVTTDENDGGAPVSVFQEMKHEDESREFNESLHTRYLSVEAIELANNPPKRPEGVPEELLSLWSLEPLLRHEYYAFLIRDCIASKARDCMLIMDAIKNIVTIRNHAMDELKLELLQGADIVGLTTTGCAKNQNLLRSLRPSVLVVEEAAEVLESQLLACMTDSLQQVVLIGDHYQLRPKVETFAYEKFNKLNMSLFERLVSRIRPICLTEQRRMHPMISRMVRPFYSTHNLVDNPDLLKRPFISATGVKHIDFVPGLAKRVFFWRHSHSEEEACGSRSKVNIKEVDMVKRIVEHLTSEGVHQRSITVITPYLGQRRLLRDSLRMRAFGDVAVSTVDLFQGDENDIVILSLVRTELLTEFLKMQNRMIVSCSRARFAMVILGNDVLLRQAKHWGQVLDILQGEQCVGDRLPVTRATSPGEIIWLEA